MDHNELWKILKEMGIPDYLIYLLRNRYAGQEATVRTGHGTTNWFQLGKGVCQSCILPPCLYTRYRHLEYSPCPTGTQPHPPYQPSPTTVVHLLQVVNLHEYLTIIKIQACFTGPGYYTVIAGKEGITFSKVPPTLNKPDHDAPKHSLTFRKFK